MKKIFMLSIITFLLICSYNGYKISSLKKEQISVLMGKRIIIDPGHGGKDNGASYNNILEDEINLNIGKNLYEYLLDDGALSFITRINDYDLASIYQKNRKKEDLFNRVKYINITKPDIFISIHLNSYPSSVVKGAQVFFQNNDKSIRLANYVQEELNTLSDKKRNIKKGDYYILNESECIGILVECGFLTNEYENSMLSSTEYQKILAKKIEDGIIKYFLSNVI